MRMTEDGQGSTVDAGGTAGSGPAFDWPWIDRSKREQAVTGTGSEGAKPEVNDDPVNHPAHYTWMPNGVEVIDLTEQFNFCVGNAVKYILRHGHKGNPVQDLEKARWYLDREIARWKRAPSD